MITGADPALRVVVMGPSGCGKSTLAGALARSLGLRFIEGDELHSSANIGKMRSGIPLDDPDRAPWLDAVAAALASQGEKGVVASCSALKRRYRDHLRSVAGRMVFILPQVPRDALEHRLAARSGHFISPELLDSQLAALEPLEPDEAGLVIDGSASIPSQVEWVRSRLSPLG